MIGTNERVRTTMRRIVLRHARTGMLALLDGKTLANGGRPIGTHLIDVVPGLLEDEHLEKQPDPNESYVRLLLTKSGADLLRELNIERFGSDEP